MAGVATMTKAEFNKMLHSHMVKLGRRGGRRRAAVHSGAEIAEWGRMGGQPRKLDGEALRKLANLRAAGDTLQECADRLGVSRSTIARAVRDLKPPRARRTPA